MIWYFVILNLEQNNLIFLFARPRKCKKAKSGKLPWQNGNMPQLFTRAALCCRMGGWAFRKEKTVWGKKDEREKDLSLSTREWVVLLRKLPLAHLCARVKRGINFLKMNRKQLWTAPLPTRWNLSEAVLKFCIIQGSNQHSIRLGSFFFFFYAWLKGEHVVFIPLIICATWTLFEGAGAKPSSWMPGAAKRCKCKRGPPLQEHALPSFPPFFFFFFFLRPFQRTVWRSRNPLVSLALSQPPRGSAHRHQHSGRCLSLSMQHDKLWNRKTTEKERGEGGREEGEGG